MSSLSVDHAARGLRALAFFHAVAEAAPYAHSWYGVSKWWRECHSSCPADQSETWRRAARGATPAVRTLLEVFERLPEVRSVYYNPLWLALSNRGDASLWDDVAATIHVNGMPLDGASGPRSFVLFSRVDWRCLAVFLILMRTRSVYYEFHRQWLQLNFTTVFSLISLQHPVVQIHKVLYQLCSEILSDSLCPPKHIIGWANYFQYRDNLSELVDSVRRIGWPSVKDQNRALFIWFLLGDIKRTLRDLSKSDSNKCTGNPYPLVLRRRWERRFQRLSENPVGVEGFQWRLYAD